MLILTRKPGESIYIGDIKVTVVEIKGHQIRVGIDAPPEVRIYREEIYVQIMEENRKAAEASATAIEEDSALSELAGTFSAKPTLGALKGKRASSAGQSGGFSPVPASLKGGAAKSATKATEATAGKGSQPEVVIRRRKQTDSDE